MANEAMMARLSEQLFSDPEMTVYAVLDGASVPGLVRKLWEVKPKYYCLFPGELEPDMAEVAPYVVELEPDSQFTQWVIDGGWGNHWGIFASAPEDLRKMRGHFRSLVKVMDEAGTPMYFRFYDPRVMRTFLPTCNAEELSELFGPSTSYRLEAEDPNVLLCLRNDAGELHTDEIKLARA